jgi:hypothetical protein
LAIGLRRRADYTPRQKPGKLQHRIAGEIPAMTMTSLCDARPIGLADLRLRRAPRSILALLGLAAVVVGGQQVNIAMQSPGKAIRAALVAAAADMRAPETAQPRRDMLQAVGRHFNAQASIGAPLWPHVTVTLHHVDQNTCVDAAAAARRIEGLVVVELENFRRAADCGASNDMTWRIMP